MKATVCVSFSVFMSLALVAVLKMRHIEIEKLEKRKLFEDIKVRVTDDMWTDLERQQKTGDVSFQEKEALLKEIQGQFASVSDQMKNVEMQAEECANSKQILLSEVEIAQKDFANMKDQHNKEKSGWEREKAELQKLLSQTSPVCDYLKPGSEAIRNLCGDKVVKEIAKNMEPKAEAPKPEEPNAEAPKPEEPNAEAPKQEEPNAEAPKQEEPNAEAPEPQQPQGTL